MEKIQLELSQREISVLQGAVKTYVSTISGLCDYTHPVYRELANLNRVLSSVRAFKKVARLEYDLLSAVQNMAICMREACPGMIITDSSTIAEMRNTGPAYIRDFEKYDCNNDLLVRINEPIIYQEAIL